MPDVRHDPYTIPDRGVLATGLLLGLLAVVLASLAAHGPLAPTESDAQRQVDTATLVHFVHALGSMLLAFWPGGARVRLAVAGAWLTGTILFSGSLYSLTLFDQAWPGPLTPLGGLLLITGWLVWLVGLIVPRSAH
ncbi:MAG: DUF423 domain-containing protein [Guyparkeria sp.]|uniref:DUF423 domain-containing protein n=1 Tax=Guyparkeria sp. TaxID=2035736 RepID=UPI00397C9159